ncbi:MAG TPA: O-antigen ligase family protein [Cyclobacteriaceae bacterium]|nr:O-antigen ligase family protein [Cyclobacteriaceae bacterium]
MTLASTPDRKEIDYLEAGLLFFFFTLPFFQKLNSLAIVLTFLAIVIVAIKTKTVPLFKLHWFLPALFVYFTVSVLATNGGWALIERRITFVLVPLMIGFYSSFFLRNDFKRKASYAYLAGCYAAVVMCFVRAVIRSIRYIDGHWVFNPKLPISEKFDFLTSAIMGGNYFFDNEFSFFIDSTYFGLYLVMALLLIFEIYRTTSTNKVFWLVTYPFTFIPLFLLSSKASMLSALLLTIGIPFVTQVSWKIKGGVMAGIVLVSIAFMYFNPRLNEFVSTLPGTVGKIDPKARFGHSLRILSWDASLSVIKENWLWGVGEGNKESTLINKYIEKGYDVPAKEMFNSHNQYLDFLLGGGIIGLGLFLFGLIQFFAGAFVQKNLVNTGFIFIFSFSAMFENLLTRYAGAVFLAAFLCLLHVDQPFYDSRN